MNPLTVLLYLLAGSQILTSLAAVSIAGRTAESVGSEAKAVSRGHTYRVVF